MPRDRVAVILCSLDCVMDCVGEFTDLDNVIFCVCEGVIELEGDGGRLMVALWAC